VSDRDRTLVSSGSPYEPKIGFSRAVRMGSHVAVAGTAPVWPCGDVDPDPLVQARRCWEIALSALSACGGEPRHVVRTRMYLTDPDNQEAIGRVHAEHFADIRPAATMVVVSSLLDPRWLVEVELDAVISDVICIDARVPRLYRSTSARFRSRSGFPGSSKLRTRASFPSNTTKQTSGLIRPWQVRNRRRSRSARWR